MEKDHKGRGWKIRESYPRALEPKYLGVPKYTKAPWRLEAEKIDEEWVVHRIVAGGKTIVYTDCGFYPPKLADAKLICAAPEMLQLLKEYFINCPECETPDPLKLGDTGTPCAKCQIAVEIIGKAEGISNEQFNDNANQVSDS